jgi:MFS family permease
VTATTERVPRGRVLALGGLSAFGPLALDLCLPGLPQLTSDLRTSEAAGQLSLSMCRIGLALGQLLVGSYTDRVGRRGPLLAGFGRFGPRRLLRVGVLLGLAAAIGQLAGVLLSRSVWAVLPPLFGLVGSLGLIFPNGTALALAQQKQAAGTASALIGLLQFALGAVVPPLASLGGVTAL